MGISEVNRSIKKAVDEVQIIDTHEHLIQDGERVAKGVDIFEVLLSHYASSDLVSSGMSAEDLEKVRDKSIPLEKRFVIFKPFWDRIQNTGYARAINIAVKDLYGLDGIEEHTYRELAIRMNEANRQGLYRWILKERSGIEVSILDSLNPVEKVDREFFAPVARFDDFVTARSKAEVEGLGRACERPIHSLSDLIEALEGKFKRISGRAVGIKIGLAYLRDLYFEKVPEREAEEVFVNIYKNENKEGGISFREARPYQDFMVHKIIQLATKENLPIQIHTGLQEGNENMITNSKPTLLINLFSEYKEARFDIFHGSYPYTAELAALAKNFPNVYMTCAGFM